MALTLGRRDRGGKVKTGANQGVVLSWQVSAAVIRALRRSCGPKDLIFPITQDKYRKEWRLAAAELGLKAGPPHAIRHTGAAMFVAAGGDLEAARRRGRWQTTTALQRYTKTHVLVNALSRMSSEQIREGVSFWESPAAVIVAAIRASPCGSSGLAAAIIDELSAIDDASIEMASFDGGRVLTTGRPSTAGRARASRRTRA